MAETTGQGDATPMLRIDDAIEHLVGYLRDEIAKPPPRMPVVDNKNGCNLWLPIVIPNFPNARDPAFTSGNRQQQETYYRAFYDAAWELCRIGVLRPGQAVPMGNRRSGAEFQGDGFSLTQFGGGANCGPASAKRPEPI